MIMQQNLTSRLSDPRMTLHGRRFSLPSPPKPVSGATTIRFRNLEPAKADFLIARPTTAADIESTMAIASHVDVASMRAARAKNELAIEQSTRTIAGELPWQQGLLLLGAEVFAGDGSSSELAGNIKLQVGWGGCWKKTSRHRLFNFPGMATWAHREYLGYQPNGDDEFALELAGLAVLPKHQGKKVARFLAQSWALFVLLHQEELRRRIGNIAYLCANVLTADANGKYPFYEQVVRPLFGGLDYDTVDAHRYARCNARSPILDEFLDARGDQPRASIPCHLLSDDLQRALGKVRDQSIGCQRNLERLGFGRTDKYDILDGGQYFENSIAGLDRATERRAFTVRCARPLELGEGARQLTLAPAGRSMAAFQCARASARIQGTEIWLGASVCNALRLAAGDTVVVLNDIT